MRTAHHVADPSTVAKAYYADCPAAFFVGFQEATGRDEILLHLPAISLALKRTAVVIVAG